MLTDNYFVIQL